MPHLYAEGPSMTLADIMLFPCFYILLSRFDKDALEATVPLVSAWYDRISESEQLLGGTEMLLKVRWLVLQ